MENFWEEIKLGFWAEEQLNFMYLGWSQIIVMDKIEWQGYVMEYWNFCNLDPVHDADCKNSKMSF